jgi:hypothetical protein
VSANPGTPVSRNRQEESDMANEGYHEPVEELSDETRDLHRAIIS